MFILDGKPLSPDRAFTGLNGVQFPANWLRLSTLEEKQAIGIIEQLDPIVNYDQRFFWNPDLPKDHAQLVEQWTAQIKTTAGSLLSQTDWYITRASETGLAAPQGVLERRADIRQRSNDKEALLVATTSTSELADYVTGPSFYAWEESTLEIEQESISIDSATSGTILTGDTVYGSSGEDTLSFN